MQIETRMKYYFTPVRMVGNKNTRDKSIGKGEKQKIPPNWMVILNCQSKNIKESFKLKI